MSDIVKRECIQIGSLAANKEQLLAEISLLAKKSPVLDVLSREEILAALKKREKQSSTGLARGLAIPHSSFAGISGFVVGLVIIRDGIDFNSSDASKSKLVFFVISPEGQRDTHVKILSSISKLAIDSELIDMLIHIKSADAAADLLNTTLDKSVFAQ